MKIEKQVTSLELSKKLKKLGVKQESYFEWKWGGQLSKGNKEYLQIKGESKGMMCAGNEAWSFYSAFTVAELGSLLPMEIKDLNGKSGGIYFETTRIAFSSWIVEYLKGKKLIYIQKGDTEADARAKMLIYLIENNLITKEIVPTKRIQKE